MGLFNKRQPVQQFTERQLLENKYNTSRVNLLIVIIFSVINVIIALTGQDRFFLFSAYAPWFLTFWGMLIGGKLPADYYEEGLVPPANDTFLYVCAVVAFVIIALYFVCWMMSKKKNVAWYVVALVLYVIDVFVMFYVMGIDTSVIIAYLFHAWVIYYLVIGITSAKKLKNLPPEEENPIEAESFETATTTEETVVAEATEAPENKDAE